MRAGQKNKGQGGGTSPFLCLPADLPRTGTSSTEFLFSALDSDQGAAYRQQVEGALSLRDGAGQSFIINKYLYLSIYLSISLSICLSNPLPAAGCVSQKDPDPFDSCT